MINKYAWGIAEDGKFFTRRSTLKHHPCSLYELNLNEDDDEGLDFDDENYARFFKPHSNARYYTSYYYKKFLCIDKDDLEVQGDYNSDNAQQLNFQLIKCQGGKAKGCKSDAEIVEYFRDKYILLYYNQIRFDSFKYGLPSISPEANLKWLLVNTQMQITIPYKVSTTKLML